VIFNVTAKGQVTPPKAIRNLLSISAGTRIAFEVQPDNTLKARVLARGAAGLFGLISRAGEAAHSLDEIDAGIAAAFTQRNERTQRKC
jgi:AbrB family looped-hinge helix DNA binding protein